jgi:hypothetical protein
MTEQEWLECTHPASMLVHLDGKATERKARLFCSACCRRVWDLLSSEGLRKAIAIAEEFPDARVEREEAVSSDESVLADVMTDVVDSPAHEAVQIILISLFQRHTKTYDAVESPAELAAQHDLLRDIFGNPFRCVSADPVWLAWNGGTVVKLAQGIYEERAFDRLPILADALEGAGSTDQGILDHCRDPGPHVRGCWVIDLLLGKE